MHFIRSFFGSDAAGLPYCVGWGHLLCVRPNTTPHPFGIRRLSLDPDIHGKEILPARGIQKERTLAARKDSYLAERPPTLSLSFPLSLSMCSRSTSVYDTCAPSIPRRTRLPPCHDEERLRRTPTLYLGSPSSRGMQRIPKSWPKSSVTVRGGW